MASFQNMVITTAGLELLQDLILEGGTPLTFSGVGVGDGLLEDSDITAKTSLVHEVHRLPIENRKTGRRAYKGFCAVGYRHYYHRFLS